MITKRLIELKGDLCAYCDEEAEFISINEESPMCHTCIREGADK